ncbi:hypothetical protein J437_LFUL011091 [Ladona fulva]|uniref:Dynein heavy chain n=1 Tax=Ladona fulva TaxID=123851 RepID=A0A8K0K8Z5_LADFU|nr:hypothetical protein J437_LFUL011091 [Ladona fulva]
MFVATDKPGVKANDYWEPGRGLLQDSGRFLKSLMTYDKNNIPEHVINSLKPYIENPLFLPEKIVSVSKACTSLCQWIHAIYKYYFVWLIVKPKKEALAVALETLREKEVLLEAARARMIERSYYIFITLYVTHRPFFWFGHLAWNWVDDVARHVSYKLRLMKLRRQLLVADRLRQLRKQLLECQSRRDELQAKTQLCAERLERANHLIYCLTDERTRWSKRINQIEQGMINAAGDSLIAGASVAYLTPFTNEYREELLSEWTNFLSTSYLKKDPHNGTNTTEDPEMRAVPYSAECDPISLLGDPILIRKWHLEGLPRDTVSTQSAVLSDNSNRWPLFIDPQSQANHWIRSMVNII